MTTTSSGFRAFRTSTFRIVFRYAAIVGIFLTLVLGLVYWWALAVIDQGVRQTIEAEIRGLAEQYRTEGLERLIEVVSERSRRQPTDNSVYLLVAPDGRRLAGNLANWPDDAVVSVDGDKTWFNITLKKKEDGALVPHSIQARTFQLPGGFRLLVGHDTQGITDFRNIIIGVLAWAAVATLALAVLGGLLISRNLLRRVENVSATSRDIIRGDLGRRVQTDGSGDEFDRLARSINEMLDQIQHLMTGMRAVTDSLGHDLLSPLSRLRSRAELAFRNAPMDAPERETLELTIADADAILATFRSLMRIAQAESGLSRAEMVAVDLTTIADEVAELYQPVAEDKGLHFDKRLEPGCRIRAHEQLLAQAIANLLDNAVKYTPENGRVWLAVRREERAVVCEIADSGPGIPAEDRERVFERFTRLEHSRTTPGNGLGLSLVAAVAMLHGAAIELADNQPGLKVTLRFPPDQAAG